MPISAIRLFSTALMGVLCAGAGLTLVACATVPEDPELLALYEETNDPFEPFNRFAFQLTRRSDEWVLRPAAKIYRNVMPTPARHGFSNFTGNLGEPYNIVYNALQGEGARAGTSLARFLINSSFGVGGLFDVASKIGITPSGENINETLAVWGVPEGPYLFIPFRGPSTVRGAFAEGAGLAMGYAFDESLYPLDHIDGTSEGLNDTESGLMRGMRLLEGRAQFIGPDRQIEREAVDLYIAFREFYRQNLRNRIRNGRAPAGGVDLEEDLDFFDDEFEGFEEFDDE